MAELELRLRGCGGAKRICESLRAADIEVWFDFEYAAQLVDGIRKAGLNIVQPDIAVASR